jgi:DNA-binding response OmpR family regulator
MEQAHTGKRALVIDDDENTRYFIRTALESFGFRVTDADCGERGLEVFDEVMPDVVLLDYKMPGMDGLECCRRLRARWTGPILMLSGHEDPSLPSLAVQAGASRFLVKPTNWCYLAGAAAKMLDCC